MRCPFCKDNEKMSKVIDSRATEDGFVTRRRRECLNENCKRRFTTYERVEEQGMQVVKRDGERVNFDLEELRISIELACRKRPIEKTAIENLLQQIHAEINAHHEREVDSQFIKMTAIRELRKLDLVAFVRYSAVYRDYADAAELVNSFEPLRNLSAAESSKGEAEASKMSDDPPKGPAAAKS